MAEEFFEIQGITEALFNFDAIGKEILEQIGNALFKEASRVLELAIQRVPVNTGALRDTGKVFPVEYNSTEISVTIGFGGEEVKYAITVHERLNVRHIKGQAKYLESVMLEEAENVYANIGALVLQ